MRMFKGRPEEIYSEANLLTDASELRSISMTSIVALGASASICSLTLFPALTFLTPITMCTPRKARARAVSIPIPFDAPIIVHQ